MPRRPGRWLGSLIRSADNTVDNPEPPALPIYPLVSEDAAFASVISPEWVAILSAAPDSLTVTSTGLSPRPTDAYIVGTEQCSLRRGCSGFCETCKTCLLHCTCAPKPAPEARRIRL